MVLLVARTSTAWKKRNSDIEVDEQLGKLDSIDPYNLSVDRSSWRNAAMTEESTRATGSFAPKGQNEIAQGRAKRHPGSYAIALGTPPPQFAKALKGPNMCASIDAPPVSPFQGLGCFGHTGSQGGASLCPGLSPCAPLGLHTLGHRQPRESTDSYNFME